MNERKHQTSEALAANRESDHVDAEIDCAQLNEKDKESDGF